MGEPAERKLKSLLLLGSVFRHRETPHPGASGNSWAGIPTFVKNSENGYRLCRRTHLDVEGEALGAVGGEAGDEVEVVELGLQRRQGLLPRGRQLLHLRRIHNN